MNDAESMALCAVRYTMGRSSYIVGDGQRWARDLGKRSPQARAVMVRDLQESVDRCDAGCSALGMELDEAGWRMVLAELEAMP